MAAINRRRRSGKTVWLAQIRLQGFAPLSRQFESREAAKAWADAEEAKLRELRGVGGVSPEVTTLTVGDLIDRYLKDPKTTALDSFKDVERQLNHWASKYRAVRVRQFGPVQILERRDALLASGLRPATVNRYVAALRRAWNWGRNTRLIAGDAIWPGEIMLDEDNVRTRFLSDGELAALLAAAKAHSATMHAAILVSIGTGVRQGELLALEWRDVDLAGGSIVLRDPDVIKNETPRSVHLPAAAAGALRELKKKTVVARQIFLNADGTPMRQDQLIEEWYEVRDAAKIADFRWHDLRHTCASYLAQNGASLLEIASVLGHKSLQATQRYAHLIPGQKVTGHDKLNAKLADAPK